MLAPSPKRVEFASSIASSEDLTGTIGATGPNVSSRSRSVSAAAPVTTVGAIEVAALVPGVVAAGHDLGARGDRRLDLGLDLVALRRRDHRPDVGGGIHRVADHERGGVIDERLQVVVVDVLHHVEALGRSADLAGVEERGPGAALGGDVELPGDVGADDEGVLAAHLEVDAGHPVGARARRPSCRSRPSR